MLLHVSCPTCGQALAVAEEFIGEQFRCKHCRNSFRVAGPPPDEGPVSTAPASVALPGSPPPAPAAATVRFRCPRCKAEYDTPASQAGTKFHCPRCGQKIQVPAPPPARTVLGELAEPEPRNRTVLGEGGGALAPLPPAPPPAVRALPVQPDVPVLEEFDEPAPVVPRAAAPAAPNINIHINNRTEAPRRYRPPPPPPPPPSSSGFGTASLVLAVIALVLGLIPVVGLLSLPIIGLALLFAFVGFIVDTSSGAGPGTSVAGCLVSLLAGGFVIVWLFVIAAAAQQH